MTKTAFVEQLRAKLLVAKKADQKMKHAIVKRALSPSIVKTLVDKLLSYASDIPVRDRCLLYTGNFDKTPTGIWIEGTTGEDSAAIIAVFKKMTQVHGYCEEYVMPALRFHLGDEVSLKFVYDKQYLTINWKDIQKELPVDEEKYDDDDESDKNE